MDGVQIEMSLALLLALVSGGSAWVATVITLKNDMAWLKKIIDRLEQASIRAHERIDNLERKG